MEQKIKQLTTYLKLSYGVADFGFIFMVTLSNTYLLMFYTDFAGITAASAGMLMMVGRIFDSLSPPIIGAAIEKSSMKWGKYRSWLLIGAPLIFIFNTLLFLHSPIPMPAKAILAFLIYTLFCIATNISYTGYTSLNSSLTNDPKERVQLSSMRGMGSALGKAAAGFFLLPMISFFGGGNMSTLGFTLTAALSGVLCWLLYLNLGNATKGKDIQSSLTTQTTEKLSVGEMAKLVFRNKNLMLLFFTDVTRVMATLVMYAMFPYFFKYVVKDINGAAPFFGIVNLLSFVGALSVPWVTKLFSKRNAYLTGNLILALGMILASLLSNNVTVITTLISIGYIGYAWSNVVTTSMYADTVDYGEWKMGKNARGLYFSMFQLSIKIGAIFSTAIAGFGLSLVGFTANAEPTAAVIKGIRVIAMGLPAVLLTIGAILLFFYDLNQKKMEQIRSDLGR